MSYGFKILRIFSEANNYKSPMWVSEGRGAEGGGGRE